MAKGRILKKDGANLEVQKQNVASSYQAITKENVLSSD